MILIQKICDDVKSFTEETKIHWIRCFKHSSLFVVISEMLVLFSHHNTLSNSTARWNFFFMERILCANMNILRKLFPLSNSFIRFRSVRFIYIVIICWQLQTMLQSASNTITKSTLPLLVPLCVQCKHCRRSFPSFVGFFFLLKILFRVELYVLLLSSYCSISSWQEKNSLRLMRALELCAFLLFKHT